MNIISYRGLGISHERRGMPCQDAVEGRAAKNGNWILALSDGAGQARFAEEAARATVESVTEFFENRELSAFLKMEDVAGKREILRAVREALENLSGFRSEMVEQFAATVLFAVTDTKNALFGHLGDGAIFAMDDSGALVFESKPENQKKNATYFAVSQRAEKHFRLTRIPAENISSMLLISDGPYRMFRDRGEGEASATALELMGYAHDKRITDESRLSDALNQMAEVPAERPWSTMSEEGNRNHRTKCSK